MKRLVLAWFIPILAAAMPLWGANRIELFFDWAREKDIAEPRFDGDDNDYRDTTRFGLLLLEERWSADRHGRNRPGQSRPGWASGEAAREAAWTR